MHVGFSMVRDRSLSYLRTICLFSSVGQISTYQVHVLLAALKPLIIVNPKSVYLTVEYRLHQRYEMFERTLTIISVVRKLSL